MKTVHSNEEQPEQFEQTETQQSEKTQQIEQTPEEQQFTDPHSVIVCLPKSLKGKSREAIDAILRRSQEGKYNLRSLVLKFPDVDKIPAIVKNLRNVAVDSKTLQVQCNHPDVLPKKFRLIYRTCEVPRDFEDLESVRQYFNAFAIMDLKRNSDGPTKVWRIKFKTIEEAQEAMAKTPMVVDGEEISVKHIPNRNPAPPQTTEMETDGDMPPGFDQCSYVELDATDGTD